MEYPEEETNMTRISRYKVTVDGVTYQVQVEDETGEIAAVSGGPFTQGEAPARAPVEVRTHLPGNVYAVLCAPGDQVNKGDTLIIVEAMKMESPIYAPESGVVQSVEVDKGQTVNSGPVLVVLT
jgi:pyruvate carboxylase subunit B